MQKRTAVWRVSRGLKALLLAVAIASAPSVVAGCNAEDFGAPDTPDTIGGNTGGTGTPYTGPGLITANRLLANYSGWSVSGNPSNPGTPPRIKSVAGGCLRDQYVDAAAANGWALKAYAALGSHVFADGESASQKSAAAYADMVEELKNALRLCSNVPTVGGGACATETAFPCPAPGTTVTFN